MSSAGDPWSDIRPAEDLTGRIERRADPHHPVDFYRARLSDGRYLFLLKGLNEFSPGSLPVLAGIDVHHKALSHLAGELVFELIDDEQVSLFRALTHDFLESTSDLPPGSSDLAAQRVMVRIERWQAMLRRRKDGLLSRQSVIGLAGEILFLKNRLLPELGVEQSLRAWRGPHRDEQDFAHGEYIFEVKTQLSTADQYLIISSEAQLDTTSGSIAVCHQTLVACSHDDDDAMSLNMLVDDLRTVCGGHSLLASDMLEAVLVAGGYRTRPEYDEERWKLVKVRIFEVQDSFPRLTPSLMPHGVSQVSYRITLGACEPFERTSDWLNGVIHGDK